MRVVFAMDSFKGSLSSSEAAGHALRGLLRVFTEVDARIVEIADGGEGTVSAVLSAAGGEYVTLDVPGPDGRPVSAAYGVSGGTAVIEVAAASGLALLPAGANDVMTASSRGAGTLMRDALDRGCKKIIVGLGGSATNDGGAGLASALGVRFLGRGGRELPPGGGALGQLERIDVSGLHPGVRSAEILCACDVTNTICGPEGASAVFGPQKGATPDKIAVLDRNLARLAEIIARDAGTDISSLPGGGAAGGLGAGLAAFCGARLTPGADLVLDAIGFDEIAAGADIVITGEGRMDGQTAYGKAPARVAARAKKAGKPVFAIVGSTGPGAELVYGMGIDAVFPIAREAVTIGELIAGSPALIADAAERLFRVIAAARNMTP